MTLEERLLEAAQRGLTHLSMHPVPSEDNKTIYWRCSATPSTGHRYVAAIELDPVSAMTKALSELPKAPRRTVPKSKDEITAAVTEPTPTDDPAPSLGDFAQWKL